MNFREAFKQVLRDHKLSQSQIAEHHPRALSPQALSQMLSPKEASGDDLPESARAELLDALVALLGTDVFCTPPQNDAETTLFRYAEERYSASSLPIVFSRAQLESLITQSINSAKVEITIIGSISAGKLCKEWYNKLADTLLKNSELNVTIFIESRQSLYWRAISLDASFDQQVRPYDDLVARNDKIIRELRGQILYRLREHNAETAELTFRRFHLHEVDIPIYSNAIKIDDTIFVTPRAHWRASVSGTFYVRGETPNLFWDQYISFIDFFKGLAHNNMRTTEGKFVGIPEDETNKIVVYSNRGQIPRGVVRRSTLGTDPKLETRAVHGLLFNKNGELLLRFRDQGRDRDNTNLWDKSCGSNIRSTDYSARSAIRRTLVKEVFNGLAMDISSRLGVPVYDDAPVVDMGQWRNARGLQECKNSDSWYFYELDRDNNEPWPFPGPRYHDELNGVLDHPHIYASVFIVICNEHFQQRVDDFLKKSHDTTICRWITLSTFDAQAESRITNDLSTYLYRNDDGCGLFSKLSQASLAIRAELMQ
ncbi:MAG: hypothetical protein H6981_14715 [Gammaproteobacteria bacterium]|nr:hypothetical protein [Gammaproteobacteria bacterium]MCP5138036.1 hypothetical protein [Gammaproteobacteria bacterium]